MKTNENNDLTPAAGGERKSVEAVMADYRRAAFENAERFAEEFLPAWNQSVLELSACEATNERAEALALLLQHNKALIDFCVTFLNGEEDE